MFKEGRIVAQLSDSVSVVYQHFKKPNFLVSSRDFVMVSNKRELGDGSVVLASRSIKHSSCPEVDGCVRATVALGGFRLTPSNGGTDVVYINKLDLGGQLPGGILSQVSKKQPLQILALRKVLSKSK